MIKPMTLICFLCAALLSFAQSDGCKESSAIGSNKIGWKSNEAVDFDDPILFASSVRSRLTLCNDNDQPVDMAFNGDVTLSMKKEQNKAASFKNIAFKGTFVMDGIPYKINEVVKGTRKYKGDPLTIMNVKISKKDGSTVKWNKKPVRIKLVLTDPDIKDAFYDIKALIDI